jgi:hypothetical protein
MRIDIDVAKDKLNVAIQIIDFARDNALATRDFASHPEPNREFVLGWWLGNDIWLDLSSLDRMAERADEFRIWLITFAWFLESS